jgi:tripartite-type tricarboxylate transporter receptor subunit TctC
MFRLATGLTMTHVPYRGGAPALTDLMAGNVPIMFANATSALPHVRGGRVRALGVTAAQRLPFLPEAPTIAEAAIPGYQIAEWYGIVGPRGMPAAAAQRLNTVIGGIITAPEMRQKLLDSGAEVVGGNAESFGTLIATDVARYGQVIRESGITAE